ncbi:MAG TPA: DEAD/DEAH box helicase [Turneriella sp.]|nr:DEAD/DEAH box helicase [Turneriella sp.]
MKKTFYELGLSPTLVQAVTDMGFREASPIQEKAIPILLEGHDLIGQAQTGTGKTAAFAIPVIEKITAAKELQAMVLCPTRELAMQVAAEFKKLLKYKKEIQVVTVYGGQPIGAQFRDLKEKPQIVVGTPGRVMDHMRRKTIKMNTVKFFVLDEADEMLAQGFREDIEHILTDAPEDRQTVLFSATMSKEILAITSQFLNNPQRADVLAGASNKPKIEQFFLIVPEKNRVEATIRLMDFYGFKSALIFSNMRSQVDSLTQQFNERGMTAEGIHGDLNQNQRDKVMARLRSGHARLLVATDVAGRGIDISHIEAVFNFDLPRDVEDYVHRIGRTGRAGKSGCSFSFVRPTELGKLRRLEKLNNIQILPHDVPAAEDLQGKKVSTLLAELVDITKRAKLAQYLEYLHDLTSEEISPEEIAAAAIKMLLEKDGRQYDNKVQFTTAKDELKKAPGDKHRPRNYPPRSGKKFYRNKRNKKN